MLSSIDRAAVPGVSPRPLPTRPLTQRALRQVLDSLVPSQLEQHHVAGMAVSIVRGDQVLFSAGYGLADTAGTPVDPATTLFRIGSVSKVFTWTAVTQLLDRGLLDENADIGRYVDFVIPREFDEPICLPHLMTHTAGFESNHFGFMASWYPEESASLGDTVSEHVPTQVRAPGLLPAYSNWGPAVAGRIVELIADDSFDGYMEREIFGPLDMKRSTFREPIPASFATTPIGFVFDGAHRIEHPFEYYHSIAPAGSMTTTAADMANFMCAQLNGGEFHGRSLASPSAIRRMHDRAPGFPEYLDAGTFGFYETWRNGRRTIGHKGASIAFESRLTLLAEEQVGIFVACNTGTGTGFCDSIVNAILDQFFPAELPQIKSPTDFGVRATRYQGLYAVTSRSTTKSEKLFGHTYTVKVEARSDRLVVQGLTNEPVSEWIEVGGIPGLFRQANQEQMLIFREGEDGSVTLLGPDPLNPCERIGLIGAPRCTFLVQFLTPIVFAVAGTLTYTKSYDSWPQFAWLAPLLALINILIVGGIARTLAYDQYSLLVAPPWPFMAALSLSIASTLLTTSVVGWAAWGVATAASLPWPCLFAVPALGFTCWLKYWNLIGFNLA